MSIKFNFYKEMKGAKGVSTWSPYGSSSDVAVEEISVQTDGKFQVINFGTTPQIIPQGINDEKGRVALLVGTFKNPLVLDSGIDLAMDVLQMDEALLGYAISLKDSSSVALLPELGNTSCKWQINSFSWDREAIKLGQWKFSMELSYIWDPTKNELKLYDDGIGENIRNNVKFSAVKSSSSSRGSYNRSNIIGEPKIDITLIDLNRASFHTLGNVFAKGDIIKIYCETQPYKAIFFGVVDDVKSKNGLVYYDCVEVGTLLQRVPCAKVGSGLFKPKIKIPNPYKPPNTYYTLEQMVNGIAKLYQSNPITGFAMAKVTDKTGFWGKVDYLPGTGISGEAKVMMPPLLLSGMNILKAISTLLEDICGLHFWFDNENGYLEYGFIRDQTGKTIDITSEIIMSSTLIESHSDEYNAGYVALYDSDGFFAKSTEEDVIGLTYISYQLNTKMSDLSLRQMAKRIYADLQLNRDQYKVRFPAGTVRFMDGDVFTCLGDLTSSPTMAVRPTSAGSFDSDPTTDPGDTLWQIKEMTITENYTECIVGASYYSIFDVYKNKLKRNSEAPVMTESKDVTTNQRVVSGV